jgi:hypothetical protein
MSLLTIEVVDTVLSVGSVCVYCTAVHQLFVSLAGVYPSSIPLFV